MFGLLRTFGDTGELKQKMPRASKRVAHSKILVNQWRRAFKFPRRCGHSYR
jgi:hypothetical protein